MHPLKNIQQSDDQMKNKHNSLEDTSQIKLDTSILHRHPLNHSVVDYSFNGFVPLHKQHFFSIKSFKLKTAHKNFFKNKKRKNHTHGHKKHATKHSPRHKRQDEEYYSNEESQVVTNEYCEREIFEASCESAKGRSVILIKNAVYGRMYTGKCILSEEFGHMGCQKDVTHILDARFVCFLTTINMLTW